MQRGAVISSQREWCENDSPTAFEKFETRDRATHELTVRGNINRGKRRIRQTPADHSSRAQQGGREGDANRKDPKTEREREETAAPLIGITAE